MADRFPLIVNSVSKKIEELVSGDNLDLTGNGITVGGDTGSGKYLTSNGTTVLWDSPGDVYLTQNQTVTNKTFETCIISGSLNTITNIPNSSLINAGINVNGVTVPLGGAVTTPDNNTTYVITAQDGVDASQKLIRLTSGGNSGAGIDDDITLVVGSPASVPSGSNSLSLFLDRTDDTLTLTGHVVDNNTITTLNAPGGSNTSGAISFTSTGAATVSMSGSTINIDALDTDTRTKIRAGAGGSYGPADTQQGLFTFLDGTGTVVAQGVDGSGDPTITYTSTDTVTQIRGGTTGTYTPATTGTSTTQVSIEGGTNVTVSQAGDVITIASQDDDTITKVGSDNNGSPIAPQPGDFILKQAGATTITQSTNNSGQVEIEISSINSDTGAILTASSGILLDVNDFKLKNASNLTGNTLLKWDNGNAQLADSIISDDGSTVTITGDLKVDGSQTIINTSVLQVEDNIIELRKGTSIVGADGGIQVNRTTDANDVVTAYQGLQWHESGGYWRSWDGSVDNRFVTENETQVLTNKTLTSPTLTAPILGAATATSINGLEIDSTASAVLDIASSKTVAINNDLTFTSDNATGNVNVNFRVGGDVAYKSDTLASFASTTATQLRTLISGTTGVDDLVFQTNPVILTGLTTTSTGFALINSGAQSIQFGGAATVIDIGNTSGTTTISGDLAVEKDMTVGGANTDLLTCNARLDVANSDILIRGGTTDPMTVGRGTSAVATNTAVGKQALLSVVAGSQNSGFGYESLLTVNSGAGNTGLGHQALRATGVGDNNTAVGRGAMLANLSGDSNVALGANALETNTVGDANVCLGFYAGYNATGTGNVLIGPADSGNPVNDATYAPLNAAGDRQLVIGSGTEFWIRGDSNFDVTLNNDVTVNSSLTVKGDFIVNGVQTVVQSNVLEVADKNIELAKVVSTQFTCTTTDGSANISAISPTLGLIPGMVVTSNTAGVTVPNGTTIASLSGNTATLSNNVSGSGTPTFSAIGPSDTAADGGGIVLKGSPSDHTFTWSNSNDAWQSSEDMELVNGKSFNIIDGSGNAQVVLSESQVGPNSGVASLGTAVTSSSLTSVGTLVSLNVTGDVGIGGASGSPSSTLHVSGAVTDVIIAESTDAGTTGANIILKHSPGAGNMANDDVIGILGFDGRDDSNNSTTFAQIRTYATNVSNNSESGDLTFHTRNSGSFGERLRIKDSGDVFIGPDIQSGNPGTKLGKTTIRGHHVNSVGSFAELYFSNSASSGGGTGSTASIRGVREGDNVGTSLSFYTQVSGGSAGDGVERLRINPSGQLIMTNTATTTFLDASTTSTGANTRGLISLSGKKADDTVVTLKLGGYGDTNRGEIFTHSNHALGFATNNAATQMVLNTDGDLIIGNTSAIQPDNYASHLQVHGTATDAGITILRYSDDAAGPTLLFGKSRGSSIGSIDKVDAGDVLGKIEFYGTDTGWESSASIRGCADGEWWSGSAGSEDNTDAPGRLEFHTTPDGADNLQERMRITSGGSVLITNGSNNDHDRDFVVNTGGSSSVYFGMTGTNSNFPWVSSTHPILSVGTDGTGFPGDTSTHSHKLVNFGIGGGAAGTSATIEHSHFAIQLNGTILSQHGIQSGGNATGGYKFNSQYSGKGYDIATQYATQANGGSGGTDPMFSGWWGSDNTLRINTDGQIKARTIELQSPDTNAQFAKWQVLTGAKEVNGNGTTNELFKIGHSAMGRLQVYTLHGKDDYSSGMRSRVIDVQLIYGNPSLQEESAHSSMAVDGTLTDITVAYDNSGGSIDYIITAAVSWNATGAHTSTTPWVYWTWEGTNSIRPYNI